VAAVQVLGHLRAFEALPLLLSILHGAEENDAISSQVVNTLEEWGPAVLSATAAFVLETCNPWARVLAMEAFARIAVDNPHAPQLVIARRAVERLLTECETPGERSVFAAYLGEMGDEESVAALLGALKSPLAVLRSDYDSIREAIERLGGCCPDYYFDAAGRGYPLNEAKHPLCPACGVSMIIRDSGELRHPGEPCADFPSGGEPRDHR